MDHFAVLLFSLVAVIFANTILILRGLEKLHEEMQNDFSNDGGNHRDDSIHNQQGHVSLGD